MDSYSGFYRLDVTCLPDSVRALEAYLSVLNVGYIVPVFVQRYC